MIVETSASVAILLQEPDHAISSGANGSDPGCQIGAPNWLETIMAIEGRGDREAAIEVARLIGEGWIRVVDFETTHAAVAAHALRTYDKGRHPAALNFGDGMAHAVARLAGAPLLCKGDDFARTGIVSALAA